MTVSVLKEGGVHCIITTKDDVPSEDEQRLGCLMVAAPRMLEIMRRVDAWSRKNDSATPPLENFDLWHDFETVLAEAEGREPDYSFEECERSELIERNE